MKVFRTVRLGVAIAGLLVSGSAFAQGGGDGGRPGFGDHRPPFERAMGPQGDHGRWWNNPKLVERLKLTDEQRKAMDDIMQQHREKLIDLRAGVEKAEVEMEPLMRDDQPNEGKILAQIDKVAQARAELEKGNARFLLAIRGKLTPDQWKRLQADRAKGADHRGWGEDGRGRGGPGQGDRGPGGAGSGEQFRHQGAPPPPPAPGTLPAIPGPQSNADHGASPDGPDAPQGGAQQ